MSEIKKRILVIDDDMDLLMLIERKLLKEGYEIETAVSLPEAEDIIPYFSPHLLLLDININGDDGRKLCWKLKKEDKDNNVKVLIMSGYDYDSNRAFLFGADELLPKPLNSDFLLQKIALHINQLSLVNEVDPFSR
jgi:DNA-binding response OmpR family regulator